MKYSQEIKKMVTARLQAVPPNVTFSLGNLGSFSRDQLIEEIKKNSIAGNAAIDMQITFVRTMPKLASELTEKI